MAFELYAVPRKNRTEIIISEKNVKVFQTPNA